jgi:hypothetical protein
MASETRVNVRVPPELKRRAKARAALRARLWPCGPRAVGSLAGRERTVLKATRPPALPYKTKRPLVFGLRKFATRIESC